MMLRPIDVLHSHKLIPVLWFQSLSWLWCTGLVFVEPGQKWMEYYSILLPCCPNCRPSVSDFYTLQHARAPAHRARDCWAVMTRHLGLHQIWLQTFQQSWPQSCRLQDTGVTSETVRHVEQCRLMGNRLTHFVSQGTAKHPGEDVSNSVAIFFC